MPEDSPWVCGAVGVCHWRREAARWGSRRHWWYVFMCMCDSSAHTLVTTCDNMWQACDKHVGVVCGEVVNRCIHSYRGIPPERCHGAGKHQDQHHEADTLFSWQACSKSCPPVARIQHKQAALTNRAAEPWYVRVCSITLLYICSILVRLHHTPLACVCRESVFDWTL